MGLGKVHAYVAAVLAGTCCHPSFGAAMFRCQGNCCVGMSYHKSDSTGMPWLLTDRPEKNVPAVMGLLCTVLGMHACGVATAARLPVIKQQIQGWSCLLHCLMADSPLQDTTDDAGDGCKRCTFNFCRVSIVLLLHLM